MRSDKLGEAAPLPDPPKNTSNQSKTVGEVLKDRAIVCLAFGQGLVWASLFYVFPASLLFWEADLGWSKTEITLAITLAVFASAISAPIAGRIIDRGYGATQIGVSAALGGSCLVCLSMVTEVWQFYALWVLIGICLAGCLYEPCFAMIVRARGVEAKRAITWVTLIAGFAGSLSFPSVYWIFSAVGWRSGLVVIGVFVVLFVAPLLAAGAAMLGRASSSEPTEDSQRSYLVSRKFWFLGLGFALIGLVHGALLHHLLPLLAERDVPIRTAVFAVSCIGPMQVLGRLAMVALQKRVSTHHIAVCAFVAIAISSALLLVAGAHIGIIGAFVMLFGGAYGTISILRPLIARDILGEDAFGAKSGGLAFLYLTASAVSAYFGAAVWSALGYNELLLILIGFVVLGGVFYIASRKAGSLD